MDDAAIENDPRVKAIKAKFPGAVIAEVRRHEPSADGESGRVTYESLQHRAMLEQTRAENSARDAEEKASAIDQPQRALYRSVAADMRHAALEFSKLAELARRCSNNKYIKGELRVMAAREAAEAAEQRDRDASTDE